MRNLTMQEMELVYGGQQLGGDKRQLPSSAGDDGDFWNDTHGGGGGGGGGGGPGGSGSLNFNGGGGGGSDWTGNMDGHFDITTKDGRLTFGGDFKDDFGSKPDLSLTLKLHF